MNKPTDVDSYIADFPEDVQAILIRLRQMVREIAPEAVEGMSYGLPGFKLGGKPLVYFGGFTKHIGFYATPAGQEAFAEDLIGYKQGKGSVQFPLSQPMPYDLIERIVRFRVEQVTVGNVT